MDTATIQDANILNIGLPKWPAFVVQGNAVTREQAAEILVRTNHWYVSTNDRQWAREVYSIAGISLEEREHYIDVDLESLETFNAAMGVLRLEYLTNSQIASAYIGGPHGWCSWSGNIGCASYNIGKWPSVRTVLREWTLIAEAFPFLRLRSQLFSGETCEGEARPLVEFEVADGEAKVMRPTGRLLNPESTLERDVLGLFVQGRERGCSADTLRSAIDIVRRKRAI